MTDKERKLALYCLKASSDYHSEVCEECIKYPNCDHIGQDDVTETIIKALEQTDVLDKIRAKIEKLQKMCDTNDLNLLSQYSAFGMALDVIDEYRTERVVQNDKGRNT